MQTYGILQRAEGVIELSGRSNNDAARRTIQCESTGVLGRSVTVRIGSDKSEGSRRGVRAKVSG